MKLVERKEITSDATASLYEDNEGQVIIIEDEGTERRCDLYQTRDDELTLAWWIAEYGADVFRSWIDEEKIKAALEDANTKGWV